MQRVTADLILRQYIETKIHVGLPQNKVKYADFIMKHLLADTCNYCNTDGTKQYHKLMIISTYIIIFDILLLFYLDHNLNSYNLGNRSHLQEEEEEKKKKKIFYLVPLISQKLNGSIKIK